MAMHKGWKRRRIASVAHTSRYLAIATADCGHEIIRMGHLGVGQRVYCGKCPCPHGFEATACFTCTPTTALEAGW